MTILDFLAITDSPFYLKADFYIFLSLSGAGLWFTILSWTQAKGAKKAAESAGKIVKIQDILLDIPEIVSLCQLDFNDDYRKANPQLTKMIGKISLVIGIIKGDSPEYESQQVIIGQIETTINEIQETFKGLNPIYMEAGALPVIQEGQTYYTIAPYLQILVSQLNLLTGNLHNQMIQNR